MSFEWTAETVIEKLRSYISAADEYGLNQARLGTEWPISAEAKAAEQPTQQKMAAAWRDVEIALRNYDYAQSKKPE